VPTTYSRVTVVNGSRRVDLALPAVLPLSDVLPQILRFCAPSETEPAAWTVVPIGGSPIGLDQTLDDAGVVDGDLVELLDRASARNAAYVEDVRDTVEDAVDEAGHSWQPRTSLTFGLGVAAAGLAAAALWPVPRGADVPALLTAILTAAALVAGVRFAAYRGHRASPQVLAVAALLWGGVAGWRAAEQVSWPGPERYAGAGVGLLLAAVAVVVASQLAMPCLGFAIPLAVAGGGLGITAAWPADPLIALRVGGALAILLVGVLPRISLTIGGLASADYQVRRAGLVTHEQLLKLIHRSGSLLTGALAAMAVIALVCSTVLGEADNPWDRWLATLLGAGLLLRSRLFSRIQHAVALRVAGLAALAAEGVWLVRERPQAHAWFGVLAVVVAAALVTLTAIPLSDITRARVKQALNWTEIPAVVALVVVTVGALGVFSWVAGAS
jgi:ESX secretion system protein EccD